MWQPSHLWNINWSHVCVAICVASRPSSPSHPLSHRYGRRSAETAADYLYENTMTSTPQCEKPEPDNAEVMLGGITPPPANEQTSDVAVHEQVLEDNMAIDQGWPCRPANGRGPSTSESHFFVANTSQRCRWVSLGDVCCFGWVFGGSGSQC